MIDFFIKGGVLMWPILACSIVALTLIVAKSLQFYMVQVKLAGPVAGIPQKRPNETVALLEGIEEGLDEKQIEFIGTKQVRKLEKGLGLLSLVSVIAPLLGFTGTVNGMIQAFMVIAARGGSRVEPSMVAGGIYEALITTAGGCSWPSPPMWRCISWKTAWMPSPCGFGRSP
jgi:biopolymer transport protein ExbB